MSYLHVSGSFLGLCPLFRSSATIIHPSSPPHLATLARRIKVPTTTIARILQRDHHFGWITTSILGNRQVLGSRLENRRDLETNLLTPFDDGKPPGGIFMAFLHSPSALDVQASSDNLFDPQGGHPMPRVPAQSGDHTNAHHTDMLFGCATDFPGRIIQHRPWSLFMNQPML